jgi:hypothetical protein
MRSLFARNLGDGLPEMAAEAGLGVVGGAAVFLLATPTGRRWVQQGTACAARGATTAAVAIASLFADLRMGWQELIQEVQQVKSSSSGSEGNAQ